MHSVPPIGSTAASRSKFSHGTLPYGMFLSIARLFFAGSHCFFLRGADVIDRDILWVGGR